MQGAWRISLLLGLTLLLGGCAPTAQERIEKQNDDGVFLFEQKQYKLAAQTFRETLQLAPNDAMLHYNLGECYVRLNESKKAEEEFQKCLAQKPNHQPCRLALASLWVNQGRREETRRMIEEWMKKQPRLCDAHALDGWYWHQVNDLPRAQHRLQQALRYDPKNSFALAELGMVYEDLNRPERSLVLYERSLKNNPRQISLVKRVQALEKKGVGPPLLDDEFPDK